MQHPGVSCQFPTLRSFSLAILVCVFGMTTLPGQVFAFQDEAPVADAPEEVVEEVADAGGDAGGGGDAAAGAA